LCYLVTERFFYFFHFLIPFSFSKNLNVVKHKAVLPLSGELGEKTSLVFSASSQDKILHWPCSQVYISKMREAADGAVLVSFRIGKRARDCGIFWTNWDKSEFSSVVTWAYPSQCSKNKLEKYLLKKLSEVCASVTQDWFAVPLNTIYMKWY
jgi:hypothetical protein